MDLKSYLEQWMNTEIVAYSNRMKYRGTLEDVLEEEFIVLTGVVVMNTTSQETSEFSKCILNVSELSSLAFQEAYS
ncbi:MAG: hypothetical protein JW738_04080 [Actinobacteria bacterium]|nr:hypothetical protein [Actinomycetota bacterium]